MDPLLILSRQSTRSSSSGLANSSNYTYLLLAASSSIAIVTWRLIHYTARRRVMELVHRVRDMVRDGPMVNVTNPPTAHYLLTTATHRAAKWMTYQSLSYPPPTTTQSSPLATQVGGLSPKKEPLQTLAPDYVLKPLRESDDRFLREIAFYEALAGAEVGTRRTGSLLDTWRNMFQPGLTASKTTEEEEDFYLAQIVSRPCLTREVELLRRLSLFTPAYYGVLSTETVPPRRHLLLKDVTHNFSRPCVLDLKMGRETYEPDATPEKKEREREKYPEQEEWGFRIVGMRVYDDVSSIENESLERKYDKMYGRGLRGREAVKDALRNFFTQQRRSSDDDDDSTTAVVRERVIRNVFQLITSIQKWFEENSILAFYASSLLIVYEGDVSCSSCDVADVKMIDFGHVRRQSGGDEGYRHGLRVLLGMLKEIIVEESFSDDNLTVRSFDSK